MWKTIRPDLESRNPESGRVVQAGLKFFISDFSRPSDYHWERTADQVRFLRPDVAQVDGSGEDTGRRDAQGQPLPNVKLLFVYMLTKEHGQWRLASTRVWAPVTSVAQMRR